jgi:Uma2 family endonuclease
VRRSESTSDTMAWGMEKLTMAISPLPLEQKAESLVNGDSLYEVVHGQCVELPPMGVYETNLASEIVVLLGTYGKTTGLGRAVCEMLFILNAGLGLKRRPDVAFVSYERWPRNRRVPRAEAWDVVPDLAVEVVSPSNTAEEILAKIREYFQAGCLRVWVVYSVEEQVYVYQSPTQPRVLTRKDDLEGEDFLPGFRLPLADLFEEAP